MNKLPTEADLAKLRQIMRKLKKSDVNIIIKELRNSDIEASTQNQLIESVRMMLKYSKMAKKHGLL